MFSLEALDARSGDALIVHFGSTDHPRLMLVDGGFASTYQERLRPRLETLRESLGVPDDEALTLDHVVVSHVDLDHVSGIVRLFRDLRDSALRGRVVPFAVQRLWHNSFSDSLAELAGQDARAVPLLQAAENAPAVAAGIADARELRDIAEYFGLDRNPPFDGLVVGPRNVDLGHGLRATVVGPTVERLAALQREWRDDVEQRIKSGDLAQAAGYIDSSVPNLSSIVLHLTFGTRTMLLTGDGRGDDTLSGLQSAGLMSATEPLRVDILKVPHHGSDRNVDPQYFERIIADHYVISGDGRHGNPSVATLQWLVESQGRRPYAVHLTYPGEAVPFLEMDRSANERNYEVRVRGDRDRSIVVNLDGSAP